MTDVSIIIPTYNQKLEYLTEGVESALHQYYPKDRYEVLIVDDGSERIQTGREVYNRFKGYRNLRFIYKGHGGIAHTLNEGIRQMGGKYFKWLSSDDALFSDALEILMQKANENTILYGNWMIMDEKSALKTTYFEPLFTNQESFRKALWEKFIGNATTSLIPRSAFKKVGLFNSSLPSAEDYEWWLRASFLHDYSFINVNRTVAKYRVHMKQLTTKVFWRHMLLHRQLQLQILEARPSLRSQFKPVSLERLTKGLFFAKTVQMYKRVGVKSEWFGRLRKLAH